MTKPDYRTICAELLSKIDYTWGDIPVDVRDLMGRARALLDQPVAVRPTVMEIIELHSWLEDEWRANNDGEDLPTVDFALAVLAKWGH
jgi:hypothetical protein